MFCFILLSRSVLPLRNEILIHFPVEKIGFDHLLRNTVLINILNALITYAGLSYDVNMEYGILNEKFL